MIRFMPRSIDTATSTPSRCRVGETNPSVSRKTSCYPFGLHLRAPPFDQVPEALDYRIRPTNLRHDFARRLDRQGAVALAVFQVLLNESGIIGDCGQRLVDLVGDGGGELAGAAKTENLCAGFLIEAQLLLHPAAFGYEPSDRQARKCEHEHETLERSQIVSLIAQY